MGQLAGSVRANRIVAPLGSTVIVIIIGCCNHNQFLPLDLKSREIIHTDQFLNIFLKHLTLTCLQNTYVSLFVGGLVSLVESC